MKKNIFEFSILQVRNSFGFRIYYLLYIFFSIITGCSKQTFNLELKNPSAPPKYPKFSKAARLLGELTPYRSCYDVTFYELNVTVDPVKKYLSGSVAIHAKAVTDFDTLQVDLYKNMKLNGVVSGNANIRAYRKEHAVFVIMPVRIKAGQTFVLNLAYEGSPLVAKNPPWQGGFVWKKDKDGKPWIGVACESEGASLWWPNKDHNSDEPDSAAMNFTVPSGLMCVSNGRLRDSINHGTQTTYKWFTSYPINNYNVTLYIGNLRLYKDVYKGLNGQELELNYYVQPWNYDTAKVHFQQVHAQLACYEKYFGEYPWYRDGFKLVESPYEGMEHQTAIAYGNGYKNDYGYFDYIILHETAHEWWGNSITAADLADVWLQEGFATYAEALYVEEAKGIKASHFYLLLQKFYIKNARPVVGPVGFKFFDFNDSDVYMKGTWILHTLRTLIGNDTLFFDIIKSFHETYKRKIVTSKDFIVHVNSKTGTDYGWFFNQYLYNNKVPVLDYHWANDTFYYRWSDVNEDFKMAVEISYGSNTTTITPGPTVKSFKMSPAQYASLSFPVATMLIGVRENQGLILKGKK